ncbi:hypothetical protein LJC04_05610 [Ruminococcaceae bacterium OttesenSCG-928-O06]|nr:hypothetical protein [Ruminococcaceae bacterium OttesenSCG-928-O06]
MKDITFEELKDRAIKVLGNYEILRNDDDELLIVLALDLPFAPDDPVFYYDGGPHGVLVGGGMPVIVCDYVHKEVRKVLEACESILLYAAPTAAGDGPDGDAALAVEFHAPVYWQPDIYQLAEQLMEKKKSEG